MFIFGENGKNFLNLKLPQAVMLTVTLSLAAALVIAGIAVYFLKRDVFKRFMKYGIIAFVLYSIAVIAVNVALNFIDDGENYQSYQLYIAVGAFIIIAAVVIFAVVRRKDNADNAKAVAYAAICLSVSFALSYIKMFRMPQGGSITLCSVTLLGFYSYMFGVKRGVLACLVYGLLQSLQDPWIVHPLQYILDYPLAYTMLGFVGLFKKPLKNIYASLSAGFALAIFLRFVCHFFSGSVYFGSYGEEFGIDSAWLWGVVYNIPVFIDGAIALAAAIGLSSSKQIRRMIAQAGEAADAKSTLNTVA